MIKKKGAVKIKAAANCKAIGSAVINSSLKVGCTPDDGCGRLSEFCPKSIQWVGRNIDEGII